MFLRSRKAQSTLEYVVVVVGIVLAVILAKQLFGNKVKSMISEDAAGALGTATAKFQSNLTGY
jgi:Na+-translocating ferredoxin:NAD+ oxidoreductase RnfD subunit